jgi:hypothetical protein
VSRENQVAFPSAQLEQQLQQRLVLFSLREDEALEKLMLGLGVAKEM